jgi:hypothetical protein
MKLQAKCMMSIMVVFRTKLVTKYKKNAFCSLSGVTPKPVSGLESNLLLWGTREASLLGPT